MNKKAANIQTIQRLDQLEAQIAQAAESQYLTVDDIRNTIHQVADIVVELSKTIPAILAELKTLAELIGRMTSEASPVTPVERTDNTPPEQVPPASGGTPAAAKKAAKK